MKPVDSERIRVYYEDLSNEELEKIVRNDLKDLSSVALAFIEAEIKKRKLDLNLEAIADEMNDSDAQEGNEHLADIESYIASLPDKDLEELIVKESNRLNPTTLAFAKEQARQRNVKTNIDAGSEVQTRDLTNAELSSYASIIRHLDCPKCKKSQQYINGTMEYNIYSIIFLTYRSKKIKIACRDCLKKINNAALLKSMLAGWWGIPWGILLTPVYIYRNISIRSQYKSDEPNILLLSFINEHRGIIELYKNDKEKLQEALSKL